MLRSCAYLLWVDESRLLENVANVRAKTVEFSLRAQPDSTSPAPPAVGKDGVGLAMNFLVTPTSNTS